MTAYSCAGHLEQLGIVIQVPISSENSTGHRDLLDFGLSRLSLLDTNMHVIKMNKPGGYKRPFLGMQKGLPPITDFRWLHSFKLFQVML